MLPSVFVVGVVVVDHSYNHLKQMIFKKNNEFFVCFLQIKIKKKMAMSFYHSAKEEKTSVENHINAFLAH